MNREELLAMKQGLKQPIYFIAEEDLENPYVYNKFKSYKLYDILKLVNTEEYVRHMEQYFEFYIKKAVELGYDFDGLLMEFGLGLFFDEIAMNDDRTDTLSTATPMDYVSISNSFATISTPDGQEINCTKLIIGDDDLYEELEALDEKLGNYSENFEAIVSYSKLLELLQSRGFVVNGSKTLSEMYADKTTTMFVSVDLKREETMGTPNK